MSAAVDRARTLIQARLAELDAEASELQRALLSLGEGSAPRPGRPRKRRARKTAAKRRARKTARAPRGQRREQLIAAIKANPGARPAELARAIGISANQAHSLIAKARKDKLLVKKGSGYALKV